MVCISGIWRGALWVGLLCLTARGGFVWLFASCFICFGCGLIYCWLVVCVVSGVVFYVWLLGVGCGVCDLGVDSFLPILVSFGVFWITSFRVLVCRKFAF